MLHTVRRRRELGESVEVIAPGLIIPAGRRKGQNPSVSSIYRALARHEKAQAYPEAVEQAHTDFVALAGAGHPADDMPRPRPARVHQPVNEELRDRLQSQQPPDQQGPASRPISRVFRSHLYPARQARALPAAPPGQSCTVPVYDPGSATGQMLALDLDPARGRGDPAAQVSVQADAIARLLAGLGGRDTTSDRLATEPARRLTIRVRAGEDGALTVMPSSTWSPIAPRNAEGPR